MATTNKAFHDAVTCILSCALQADSDIQRLADERIKALEMVDDYPFTLVEIIGSNEEALQEKHMASIFLKNYFYDVLTGRRENVLLKTDPVFLCRLCLKLVDLMSLNFVSIKVMVCKSLSYIVYKGYWGIIDHLILSKLKSDNEEQVYNAVFFLSQLLNYDEYRHGVPIKLNPEYFDVLLNISQRNITSEIRYTTIAPMYFIICYCFDMDKERQENALSRLGLEFYNVLKEPYHSTNSDFKLKCEIVNHIAKFDVLDPTKHCYLITNSLPAIGQLMTNCCDQFKEILKGASPIPRDFSEDEDNDSSNFIDLINSIVDLITNMVFSMYFDLLLEDLDNLMYCLFVFMCAYNDMEEELFLEDEEKSRIFLIRTNVSHVLSHIRLRVTQGRRKGSEIFYKSILNVFHQLMEEVQLITSNRHLYHARVTESLMYGLGVLNYNPEIDSIFPHRFYLDNWTVQMSQETNPIVKGRLLWLGGIFSHLLTPNTLSIHLKSIIQNFQGEAKYLYVPSAEALRNHMVAYTKQNMSSVNCFVIKSLSKEIIECLLTMIQKINNNPTSCLNALGIFIKYHEECAFTYIRNIQEVLINVIYTHSSNIYVMKEVNFIIGNISIQKTLQVELHRTMVPFLCKILHGDIPVELQGKKDAPEKAIELLNTIVTYTSQPISEALIVEGFCGAVNLILDTEQEHDINMNEIAVNFITTIIVKVGSQLEFLRNSKNIPLTEYVPKVIFECLDTGKPLSGLQIGKLCVISIVTLPNLMEQQFEAVLKSVLSGIQIDDSFDRVRGLWLTFIYIFMCRPANTTNFLSSIPGPIGGSALNFLINMWQPIFISMISKFERTVIAMALVQIITFALQGNMDKLNEVEVHLSDHNGENKLGAIEYFYYILIGVLFIDQSMKVQVSSTTVNLQEEEDYRSDEDDMLLQNSPLNIDLVAIVARFLKHANVYYFNVCRNHLYHEEIVRLSNLGCAVPQISME